MDHILCDSCDEVFHLGCLGVEEMPQGPWHCTNCRKKWLSMGKSDPMLDEDLM